ncbi:MAG TPA: DHA2 family efflux MFS transporter permease subunit [Rhodopila sp.]|nr:DHA2 family efflux MFS transporter permease subunit [Rhodopila sp.]
MANTAQTGTFANEADADVMADNVPHRAMITTCCIGATILQSLDQTIANVAMPYMQGSFSASFDEITWVLTSYITAAAIMTAPVGWLAVRFGRKPLYIGCIIGFTVASMMCGAAQSLGQIVGFRLLQGMFSAALVPLSQATLLDIYPAYRRGFAMAIWGTGVMIGPIMGPTLGGFLTEQYNWRWVFYINLPFGVLAAAGLMVFMPRTLGVNRLRFDWLGFAVLSAGIGGLQLMLDRGQEKDWFYSTEIIVETVIAGLGFYLFFIHMMSARQPLIRPSTFRDRNFSSGLVMMFAVGTLLVSSLALMTPWLQGLSNYPVQTAGMIMAPRGLGNLSMIMLAGRLSSHVDPRYLVGTGLLLICASFYIMTGWTPDVSQREIIVTIMIQGGGMGLFFTPLQVLSFATLPSAMRTEGASLFSLLRNIGAAIGVSVTSTVLARNTQALHEMIGASVNPFNRALLAIGIYDPVTRHGAAILDQEINRQAQIIAYADDYVMLICTTLPAILLLFVMRKPAHVTATEMEPVE